jgi:hypothetical protein
MKAGYVKVTMLDPHSASNAVQGQQYSVSHGMLGEIARHTIDQFQSDAKDPPPFVPSDATSAEVFYQRSRWDQAEGGHYGIYNLWGQVPVYGQAHYYDLTGHGISHSGKFAVYDWYMVNVVPTLGQGTPFLQADALSAALATPVVGTTGRGFQHVDTHRVTYAGTAAPGAVVKILASRPHVRDLAPVARAIAGPNGTWQATTRPMYSGLYKVVARSTAPVSPRSRPVFMRPTDWVGVVAVNPGGPSAGA